MRVASALVVLTACAAGCSSPSKKPGGLDLWLSPIHGETALVLSPVKPGFY